MAYDEATAERVRRILSARRDVAEKKLMGGLTFMVKGAMCCSVSGRGGLMVRVGAEAYERALAEPHVRAMEMRGRPMTGFVRIDPDGYETDAALRKWITRGVDFVVTLPAGGSRKKASGKKASRKKASGKPRSDKAPARRKKAKS